MGFVLDDVEARVLGCLIEKEAATPEYYPMTLNALANACNQKSNRDPVVTLDEDTVADALDRLREKGLADRITGAEMRVPKFGHRLSEVFNFDRRESAVIAELLLRGPQTGGELRSRSERMYHFDDLATVESTLARLAERQPEPLVVRLARQPGSREARWAQLLAGTPPASAAQPESEAAPRRISPNSDDLRHIQSIVEGLQKEVADLKRELEALRHGRD